jgi:hypothetical protein
MRCVTRSILEKNRFRSILKRDEFKIRPAFILVRFFWRYSGSVRRITRAGAPSAHSSFNGKQISS